MENKKEVAILKRDAIRKANQTMLLSVAGAALVSAASVVTITYMLRTLNFNIKILTAQGASIQTIKSNIKNIDDLKKKLSTLETDTNLKNTTPEDGNPLRRIADALPADRNESALGASIQRKLLDTGVNIDSLNILVSSQSSSSSSAASDTGASSKIPSNVKSIEFTTTVSAKFAENGATTIDENARANALNNIINTLTKLEKSIRAVNIKNFKFETSSTSYSLTIVADSYYYPEYKMKLTDTIIKPDEDGTASSASSNSTTTSGGNK